MNRKQNSLKSAGLSAAQSLAAGFILLLLLHRAIAKAEGHSDLLFMKWFRDLGDLEWTWPYLAAVAIACALSVVKRDHAMMARVQWYALGGGLFLTLLGLGALVGEKVDPRFLFAVLGGIASLYSCYACLFGHAAISILCRTRR